MPKVSKTGAREEDKVEGSQTKIKEVQSGPCSPSAKPAMDLQCGAGEGSWSGVPTGVCSGAGFPSSYAHLLGEEHPGSHETPPAEPTCGYLWWPRGDRDPF